MRKLASVQRIVELHEIPGADKIEVATVLGWQVVVRKGEFKANDLCIYFEIDSILPDLAWSDFMRPRKFRVKTIKLRKQISQGLCLPVDTVLDPAWGVADEVGYDLTEAIGVKKHDPQGDKERAAHAQGKSGRKQPHKWLLRLGSIGCKVHQLLYPRASGSWPEWFPKTDETRVQNLSRIKEMCANRWLYATEKLDGQSATYFYHREQKTGLFNKGLFGVCSRNIWYKSKTNNNWWNLAEELDIQMRLENFCQSEGRSLAIQGEIVGKGIQGNHYQIEGHRLYVYNVYDIEAGRYLNISEKYGVILQLGFEGVPHCHPEVLKPKERDVADWLLLADGFSYLTNPVIADYEDGETSLMGRQDMSGGGTLREGIVIRDTSDDSFSFKAISNKWLLKGGE